MQFALVIGNVVSTQKDDKIMGRKLLLIQPLTISFEAIGSPLVAIDAVGAGEGEVVLYVSGSSARQTKMTEGTPCDCAIMAIIDTVEKDSKVIFRKGEEAKKVRVKK